MFLVKYNSLSYALLLDKVSSLHEGIVVDVTL